MKKSDKIFRKTVNALMNNKPLPDCTDDEFPYFIAGIIYCSMFYFTVRNYSETHITHDPNLKEKYFEFVEATWNDFMPMKTWLTGE